MNDLQNLFNPMFVYTQERGFPFSNIYLEDDFTIVEYALAGYKKENLKIDVVDSVLIVDGTFNHSTTVEPADWVSRNITQKNFKRTLRLKSGTTVQRATFVDGILKIYLKVRETSKTSVSID
jgi:HSP20 family molecular chaperone IbpA